VRFAAAALLLLVGTAAPAFAEPQQDVVEAIGRCAGIADGQARLACYDQLAPRVKDAIATPPLSLNRAPTAEEQSSWFGFDLSNLFGSAPAQQTTPAEFGANKLPETHAKEEAVAQELDSISAGVTDYSYTPFGRFIVFLDNGQVWRQIEGDVDRATFRKLPKDNKITISRGLIGSYNLSINGSARQYKVTRVK
jgi:hypothetical protein